MKNANRTHCAIPAHHTQHYFAPGAIEHHSSRRHLRHLARWLGRVLGLLCMSGVVAAGVSLVQRGGA